jgi:hypothetical protein
MMSKQTAAHHIKAAVAKGKRERIAGNGSVSVA